MSTEINQFYGNQVSYFFGDGLNVSAKDLGLSDLQFRIGDKINIMEYDTEHGEYTDIYKVTNVLKDEDGNIFASVMFYESGIEE